MRVPCPKCNSQTALGDVHCFKCGYKRITYITRLSDTVNIDRSDSLLPEIYHNNIEYDVSKFPIHVLEYLIKYDLISIIKNSLGIGYHSTTNSLIFTYYDKKVNNSKLFISGYVIKFLSPNGGPKTKMYGDTVKILSPNTQMFDKDTLIIVEDSLSALKIKGAGYNVLHLGGTFLPTKIYSTLMMYKKIVFWLDSDNDKPNGERVGRLKTHKNIHAFDKYINSTQIKHIYTGLLDNTPSVYYVNYSNIIKDPKEYMYYEIRDVLCNHIVQNNPCSYR